MNSDTLFFIFVLIVVICILLIDIIFDLKDVYVNTLQSKIIKKFMGMLIKAFSFYFILIFAFAVIYGVVYIDDRKSFYFGGLVSSYTSRLSAQCIRLNILNEVSIELQGISKEPIIDNINMSGYLISESKVSTLHYNVIYSVHLKEIEHLEDAGGRERYNPVLLIKDKNEKTLLYSNVTSTHTPRTIFDFTKIIAELTGDSKESIDNYDRLLKSLDENFPEAEQVSFLNFLYFSVITQMTVGYGDILPNNELARFFVILQTVTSTIWLVFVIPNLISLFIEANKNFLNTKVHNMNNEYTAIIKQDGDWWIGWIEEVQGVNCQEASYSELLASLKITLQEALVFNREEAMLSAGSDYREERIAL